MVNDVEVKVKYLVVVSFIDGLVFGHHRCEHIIKKFDNRADAVKFYKRTVDYHNDSLGNCIIPFNDVYDNRGNHYEHKAIQGSQIGYLDVQADTS